MRYLSIFFLIVSLFWIQVLPANVFRQEADDFIKRLPPDLQREQASAIRAAENGKNQALQKIRGARNIASPLPEGVESCEITPTLRLYRPTKKREKEQRAPLLIYFHGGGWTIGSINSCSKFCGALAQQGDLLVLAVDYRLAPEHPFPQGLEDCLDAVAFARQHVVAWGGSLDAISLGGDSSGGELALSVALRLQQEKELQPLRSLVLFYPVVYIGEKDSESWKLFGARFGLDAELMNAFIHAYTNGEMETPKLSPLEASDERLKALPPLLFIAADRDILRDQGKVFVARLKQLNVPVNYVLLSGTVHLFITVSGQNAAFQTSIKLTCDFLNGTASDKIKPSRLKAVTVR
ncbi:MAG: alpha/beta hydrolase [Kiritimatiellia bacterium]